MKPTLAPLYFDPGRDGGFDAQLANLKLLLAEGADFLDPVPLGTAPPVCVMQ